MSTIEAIILGIIQGLTEFLPVSSSGHIEIGSALLHTQTEDNLLFTIVLHGATALSTMVVFRNDILQIIRDLLKFQINESLIFSLKIILSIIPVMIVGLLFEKEIESFFGGKILFVGGMLIITSLLLAFSFYAKKREGEVSFKKAFIIGLAQAAAILPGISRSGSTIATGLLLGVKKEEATRFSFLMVLIPILGAAFLKTLDFVKDPSLASNISISALSGGFLAAFLAGLAACTWMINIVKKGKLIYFAIYCFIVGSFTIVTMIL